jgi:CRP-like cAMP-binding protein
MFDMLTSASHPGPSGLAALPVELMARPETARSGARRTDALPRNELLSALPAEDLAQILPCLERVPLKRRQILQERNLPVVHAYFIERGAASLLLRAGERGAVEVGTLGCKDFIGVPIVLGTVRSPHRCMVQVAGEALRIGVADLRRAMDDMPALRRILFGYVQAAMVQSAQLVVCNTRHALGERLARWLLVAHDRMEGDEIPLTHQCLSRALGVRRAGVTTAMGRMEEAGLIRRGRGRLVILDREGLEGASCECHRAIRAEHQRVRPGPACDGPFCRVLNAHEP